MASYEAISDRFAAAKEDFLKYFANSVAVFGMFVAPFRVIRPLGSVTATRKSEVDWRFAGSYLEKCEPLAENRSNRYTPHVDEVLSSLVCRAKISHFTFVYYAHFVKVLINRLASLINSRDCGEMHRIRGKSQCVDKLKRSA